MSEFGTWMRDHLARIEDHNAAVLDQVAEVMFARVAAGGVIYTGGAGHSLALVCETFYRAGGLACVYPLYEPEVLPLHGARDSTLAERRPGLAEWVLAEADPRQDDLAVIFSNSGVNPYPVELAEGFRRHGLPVVAVVSRTSAEAAPPRAAELLVDVADHVIDTLVPAGEVAYPPAAPRTGPLSSLAGVYLWNLLLARLTDLGQLRGTVLPLWTSSNVAGGDASNASLFERYAARITALLGGGYG